MSEFKSIILAVDEERIQETIKRAKGKAINANKALDKVNSFLQKELSEEEIRELIMDKRDFIDSNIKLEFPKAKLSFNLEATGQTEEYEKIINCLNDIVKADRAQYLKLEEGRFILPDSYLELIREKYTKRTKNQRQNEVFEYAKKISEMLKIGLDNGMMKKHRYIEACMAIPYLRAYTRENIFEPHFQKILKI